MLIRKEDMTPFHKSLGEELQKGNEWVAYDSFDPFSKSTEFFKNESEAEDYCISNNSDRDSFTGQRIKPLYLAIENVLGKRSEVTTINGFYEITPIYENVKVNPDQNALHNPDGNSFTDTLIEFLEKNQAEQSQSKNTALYQDQLTDLQNIVERMGFGSKLKDQLKVNLDEGKNRFRVSVESSFGDDKMQYSLHFHRQLGGIYSFEKYDATLQKAIMIEDVTINGINTKELESRMKKVDWNYNIDGRTDRKRFEFVQGIVTDLSKLDVRNKNLLQAKFWTNKPFGQHPLEKEIYSLINWLNQYSQTITIRGPDSLTAEQSYHLLNKRSALFEEIYTKGLTKNNYSLLKNNFMNQDNLEYLKKNLLYTGFGERLNADLEKQVATGASEFVLNDSVESNKRKMEATLHFKKGEQNEMYFFNKYEASLIKADGNRLDQTFYIEKGRGITLREAANLLEGRTVNKDFVNRKGEEYNAWVKLDFANRDDHGNYEVKRYHTNYGYELEKALEKHPIKELDDPKQKEDLFRSLNKGNLQSVTFIIEGIEEKRFIAANPESGKSNKLEMYDANMYEITTEMKNTRQQSNGVPEKKEETRNEVGQNSKPTGGDLKSDSTEKTSEQKKNKKQKKEDGDELLSKTSKKNGKGKGKGDEDDLLTKKRTSEGKGIRM